MDLIIENEDVWATTLDDKPGDLASRLSALAQAGVDLDFLVARRTPDQPGKGVVFITPLRGDAEIEAATELGFSVTNSLHSLCVQGQNEPGIAAKLADKVAGAGINLRGMSAAALGSQFVVHFAFDTEEDRTRANAVLQA
jgi:hypothetical protein